MNFKETFSSLFFYESKNLAILKKTSARLRQVAEDQLRFLGGWSIYMLESIVWTSALVQIIYHIDFSLSLWYL